MDGLLLHSIQYRYSDGTLAAIRLGFEQGFARCAAAEESGQAAVNTQVSSQLGALSSEITALKVSSYRIVLFDVLRGAPC